MSRNSRSPPLPNPKGWDPHPSGRQKHRLHWPRPLRRLPASVSRPASGARSPRSASPRARSHRPPLSPNASSPPNDKSSPQPRVPSPAAKAKAAAKAAKQASEAASRVEAAKANALAAAALKSAAPARGPAATPMLTSMLPLPTTTSSAIATTSSTSSSSSASTSGSASASPASRPPPPRPATSYAAPSPTTNAAAAVASAATSTPSKSPQIRWSSSGLMRLCKPLLDSTIGTDPWFKYVRASADALASPHATSLLLAAGYCFRTTGELREELLPLLWEPLGLHRDDYGSVLLLLCQTGVLFLAEHTEHGRRWVMPRRLPESPPEMAIERWARAAEGSAKEGGVKEMLALMYDLGSSPPPGLAERLMAACYGIGQYRAFWKRGAIIETRIGRAHLLIELRAVRTRRRRPPLAASPAGNEGGGGGKRGGGKGGGDGNASGDADDEEEESGLGYEYDYSYELAMETRGPHAMRAEIWGLLLRLRPRVEALLAEWPEVKRSPQLCCPGCLAKREPTPSRWPADAETRARAGVEVMPTCPKCESPCDLVGIQPDGAYPEEPLALSMPHDVERSVPPNPAPMKFGQPVQASMSLPRLLGVDKRRLDDLMRPPEPGEDDDGEGGGGGGGVEDDEAKAGAEAAKAAAGGAGGTASAASAASSAAASASAAAAVVPPLPTPLLTENAAAEAAAVRAAAAAGGCGSGGGGIGSRRERRLLAAMVAEIEGYACPAADPFGWTDKDWLHYLMSGPAEELRLPDGMPSEVLDRGHGGMSLEDFARLPEASRAGLNRAHIPALRLATSSAFRRITGPLFVGCSDSRPHPYPATVAVLSEAITALQRGRRMPRRRRRSSISRPRRRRWRRKRPPTAAPSAWGACRRHCSRRPRPSLSCCCGAACRTWR